jgi:hypothetical protein
MPQLPPGATSTENSALVAIPTDNSPDTEKDVRLDHVMAFDFAKKHTPRVYIYSHMPGPVRR